MAETLGGVQAGFEDCLRREAADLGARALGHGTGWVRWAGGDFAADWCFPHWRLALAAEWSGRALNPLAAAAAEWLADSLRGERVEGPWPLAVAVAAGEDGLARRGANLRDEVLERLRKRLGRVARLAEEAWPATPGPHRGGFLFLDGFDRLLAGRELLAGGQRRMRLDPAAPSRSYLKVEEAFGILGREPAAGETVADLGAAPGGWSYAAAQRGARVAAVDNGPLKDGAAVHPLIEHRPENAYTFRPDGPVDWLFCDMVDDPANVLELVAAWLREGRARRLVLNLKCGRTDPLAVLRRARTALGPFLPGLRARHLFHDREEITLVGETSIA